MDRQVEALFAGHPVPVAVVARVRDVASRFDDLDVRVTKSEVAFRRRRAFAYVWRPGQYLSGDQAPAVLSIALRREDRSPRWKEVVHPSTDVWMHHLPIHDVGEFDAQVEGWLREAAGQSG